MPGYLYDFALMIVTGVAVALWIVGIGGAVVLLASMMGAL